MTVCNMSIEAGARAGLIAPDDTTFEYLHGRPRAPKARAWDAARGPLADAAAATRRRGSTRRLEIDASTLEPMITFGTNPGMSAPVTGRVPDPERRATQAPGGRWRRRWRTWASGPGSRSGDIRSTWCSSAHAPTARLSDLRAAASVLRGRRVAPRVRALVVPGSREVKRAAEAEGLRPRLPRRRGRVARARLLDVHRDER